MAITQESDLYLPVKSYFTSLGFTVRGEVGKCDVVAVCDAEMVAVELKRTFNLALLYQAVARLSLVDAVYVAVPRPDGKIAQRNWARQLPDMTRLCRTMGIGLLSVWNDAVTCHSPPNQPEVKRNSRGRRKMMREFSGRSGDHNTGGTTRRERVTAYREGALKCLHMLANRGDMSPADLGSATGVMAVGPMLRKNVYGWFARTSRGVYGATDAGIVALGKFQHVIAAQNEAGGPAGRATAAS